MLSLPRNRHSARINGFYIETAHKAQSDFLFRQLNSINFTRSSCLPNADALQDVLEKINEAANEEQAIALRRVFISEQIEKGTEIRLQDANYRTLERCEVNKFLREMTDKSALLPCYREENKRLLQTLLKEAIVIPCNQDTKSFTAI